MGHRARRLVSDEILNMVGPQARMVYVGKHSGFHTRSQVSR
jgi:siroheme synthase